MRNALLPADILLPQNVDMSKWAVVSCDQFTSEPKYWQALADYVGGEKSTLDLIFPEVYLGDNDEARIAKINATMEDYLVHQSLCFPDVRLKNCIEIRNHDSQNLDVAIGIGAIYKGLLYNDNAIDKILDYFAPLNSSDLEDLGFLAAKFGVNYNIEKLNTKAFEIVKKLLYLAQFNLKADEQKYLDWLIDLVNSKRCIADIILDGVKNNL